MDNEPILKKTLMTVGAMVGALVAFVGTVSLVAVLVTSHVVGASSGAEPGGSTTTAPAPGVRAKTIDPLHPTPGNRTPAQRAHDTI